MNDGSKLALTLVLAIAFAHFFLGGRGAGVWAALTGPGDPLGTAFHVKRSGVSSNNGGTPYIPDPSAPAWTT